MKVEHYVTYFVPGTLFAEDTSVLLAERTVDAALKLLPKLAFGFKFFDVEVRQGVLEDGSSIVDRKSVNESHMYYPGGTVKTLPEIEAEFGPTSIIAENMRCNHYLRVVKTRRGNYQPYFGADEVMA